MRPIKITIITPSFNQGEFIGKTIQSVVSQKGNFEIEYFIFDGGSTDDSVKVIKKYARQHPFIKWVSKKDKGQVDVLNRGLKLARGNIVAYLNSDDFYLPGSFDSVSQYFASNPSKQWVVGNCQVTKKRLRWTFFLKHLWPIQWHPFFLLVFDTINQPSVFLKHELINQVGYFNDQYHFAFDYDFWLRCLKHSLPGRIYQDLSVFRVHSQAKGSTGYRTQFSEDFEICSKNTNNVFVICIHKLIQIITLLGYKFLK